MSVGEDADAASKPLLKFGLGVGMALKIDDAPVCASTGHTAMNSARADVATGSAASLSFTIPPEQ
jgi:hypothetical protein